MEHCLSRITKRHRKRIGAFLLLIIIFVAFLAMPLKGNACVSGITTAITDVSTDSADMAAEAAQHAAKMLVLNAIKAAIIGLSSTLLTFVNLFLKATIVGILLEAFSALLIDSATGILTNVIELTESTSTLFEHEVGQFFTGFSFKIGWMFWIIGVTIAILEIGIIYKSHSTLSESAKNLGLNIFKSFLAVSLFTTLPVKVYLFVSELSLDVVASIFNLNSLSNTSLRLFDFFDSSIAKIICAGITIYAAFKVFLSVVKRACSLLILITVGSLHMVSIPRGYWDGFNSWMKQVIALCFTNFCQIAVFAAGVLLVFSPGGIAIQMAGLSCVLAANDVPKIADKYGMDTSIRTSASSAVYTISSMARHIPH